MNSNEYDDPDENTAPEVFLEALKPVPEYKGPEFWYRTLAALAEERKTSV